MNRNREWKIDLTIRESFIHGFRVVMLSAVGLALASALSAFVMIEGKVVDKRLS